MKEFSLKEGVENKAITEEALDRLMQHDWPGNVRELKNIIERLVIMTSDRVIRSEDIPPFIKPTVQEILEEEILSLDSFGRRGWVRGRGSSPGA